MAVYWYILILIVILRAVLRLEFKGARFPCVTLMPASHLERASARLETRGRKWWIIGILTGVFTFTFIDTLRDLPLISRLGPTPDPLGADLVIPNAIGSYLLSPLYLCGTIFQAVLNYRSKTFAGQHKLAAWMLLAVRVIDFAAYIPWLAWRAGEIRSPYSFGDSVTLGLAVVLVVQGVLYKKVPQDIEDEDTN
ncbi:hypothetical protein H1R20_g8826, partial [Candolleomyces eurysporus]